MESDLEMDAAEKLSLLTTVSIAASKSSPHQFSVITTREMKRKESRSKAPVHDIGEVGKGKRSCGSQVFPSAL